MWIVGTRKRGSEPGVLVGRVVRHDVDQQFQSQVVRALDETVEVFERSVLRIDVDVIGDVVAVVFLW